MLFWKYRKHPKHKYKHAFITREDAKSICGSELLWYNREYWRWDKAGLDERDKCRKCLKEIDNAEK